MKNEAGAEKVMEHTKGPWMAHEYNLRMGSLISFGDISKGENIAFSCAQRDPEEGKANARLIAAAPELLKALRKAEIGLMLCNPLPGYDMKTLHIVRAAIEKVASHVA